MASFFVLQFHKGNGEFGWLGRGDNSKNYWGGANRGSRKCSCGQDKRCGGEDGQSSMMSRYLFYILPHLVSDSNYDSDCKPNDNIVICKNFSHCTESNSDTRPNCHSTGIGLESESKSECASVNVNKP